MKIRLESVFISDIDKALAFYTDVLGFVKKRDIPMGETRYVTVVSPDEPDATELMLEPCGEHPATKAFKKAIYEEGIPLTAFLVDDIAKEYPTEPFATDGEGCRIPFSYPSASECVW